LISERNVENYVETVKNSQYIVAIPLAVFNSQNASPDFLSLNPVS